LLMFSAVFSALFYTVFVKKLATHYNPVILVAYQNFIGMVLFIPVFLITDLDHFLGVRHTLGTFMPVIELAVFASALAFVFFVFAIRHTGIARTNVFTNLIPAFTGVFSFFILGEKFSALKIAGVVIVVGGLLFTQLQRRRPLRLRHLP
jgi:drug/metabolite transporter (DMT)-like permease